MATFTALVPLNLHWYGNALVGAVGATHRIPDAMYDEFHAEVEPNIKGGVTWTSLVDDSNPTVVTLSSLTATAARFKGGPWYDVKGYGAVGDGATDDTTAVQNALTAAFNAPGGIVAFPVGTYKLTSTLVTPNSTAGAVTMLGMGRPNSFTGGSNGDPSAGQGSILKYTGSTGDIFSASLTTANKRQYITFEALYFQGNTAGASGHGIHLQSTVGTSAVIPTYRDVTVNGAKQHGIFHDGNVFEGQLYNVRLSQNGDRGFKAASNGSALPGETRFYGISADSNSVGIDLAGGGHWSLHGVTASFNTAEGILATSVSLEAFDLNIEQNGTTSGNQVTLTSLSGAYLAGLSMTVKTGSTGNGISFVSCNWCTIQRYNTNASTAGAGYNDFRYDTNTSRCTVNDYTADDATDRFTLGSGGGHQIRRGASWQSYQTHNQKSISCAATSTVTPDATLYDSFIVTSTTTAITVTVGAPTVYFSYHNGQRISFTVFNNTAGALTVTWNAAFHLAGAWVNPAAGKTRTIVFEWDNTRSAWYELNRAAADIT